MTRPDGRAKDEMRAVKLTTGFTMYAEGSVIFWLRPFILMKKIRN